MPKRTKLTRKVKHMHRIYAGNILFVIRRRKGEIYVDVEAPRHVKIVHEGENRLPKRPADG